MAQIINTNIASLNAQRNLNNSQAANATALERLSSGLRINSAKDDAAGLAISTRFESQTRGLGQAVRNAGDGISLAQTAEGALASMTDNLQRVRELAVQSANGTNSDDDRIALQAEVKQLVAEIERTSSETNFNGRNLFDGSFEGLFQIGANAGQTVGVQIGELTVDRLGSSTQVGVSAFGTDDALANGDLSINGIAIDASRAGDDNASTVDAAASAISKVEAINRKSDETGVTAYANENVAAGSAMTGGAASGSITLNGVTIDISTSTDASNSRASVVDAINAVSDQTGITAVNTDSAANGVQLVAEDGRNIDLSFDTVTAENTGLAAAGTYYGGYTLIADAGVNEITVGGGNGTGRGDLANAGLTAGTYSRAVASSVSEAQGDLTTASGIGGGSLANTVERADNTATLSTSADGTKTNLASTTATDIQITTAADISTSVQVGSTEFTLANTAGQTVAGYATSLNASAATAGIDSDVEFYEEVDFKVTGLVTNNSDVDAGTFTLAGESFNIAGGTAGAELDEARLVSLMEQINAADFSAVVGADGSIQAELNENRTELSIRVKNYGAANITASTDAATTTVTTDLNGTGGSLGVSGTTAFQVGGNLAYESLSGETVKVTSVFSAAGDGEFLGTGAATTQTTYNYGAAPLTSTAELNVSVKVGDNAAINSELAAGSSVAQLAAEVNGTSGVTAWEEISLKLDDSNFEAGDTLRIGGTDVLLSGDDSGNVTMATIAQDINGTDFSGANFDVSAVLNDAGDEVALTIRNYSGSTLAIESENAEGRGVQVDDGFVGELARSMSGELKFMSDDDRDVQVSLSDPEVGGEFFVGNSDSDDYSGPNGLKDGDLLINGVTIGAAQVSADTSSATLSSDGSRILSSSKESSAIAVAASINEVSERTGVTATVNETRVVGGDGTNADPDQFEAGDQGGLFINGVNLGSVTLQADSTGAIDTDRARTDALNLINQNSGKTGVVAVDNGVSLTLTAADGRNVSVAIDDQSGQEASIGALFGLDAAVEGIGEATFGTGSAADGVSAEAQAYETTYGSVTLESAGQFTLAGGSNGTAGLEALGLRVGNFGGGEDGQFLKDIDISTVEGAQSAIASVDNALDAVSSVRSDLGAIQNRFESTISNLEITKENLTAANSRIRDADFAAESAELSRTQVLQQAGISILAQANQRPQQALSLLG